MDNSNNEIWKDIIGFEQYYKVRQYTLDGKYIKEWDSLTDIQNELGFCRSNISKCCKGEYKQANNFIWKFKKD